jgi:uncharacterized membrane protein YdjX (TVP38/TMEM64 family)
LTSLARIGPRIAAGAVIAVGAAWALLSFHRGALDPAVIRDAIQNDPLAPAIFVGLQVLASLLFVPRTILGIAAGLIFGLAWGSFWALLGAEAGAAAGFALVRWIGAGRVNLENAPRLGPLIERAERGGWRSVALLRLVPGLPHSLVNTALGLTRISWRDYLIGSFAGMLPMTVAQVDIGAAGGMALAGGHARIVATLVGVLGLAATYLIKKAFAKGD